MFVMMMMMICTAAKTTTTTNRWRADTTLECPAGHDDDCEAGGSNRTSSSSTAQGFYYTPEGDNRLCPRGSYCRDGLRRPCPAGRFGAVEGLDSPACSGVCDAGYFCEPGSTDSKERGCPPEGSAHCPAGAERPIPTRRGYVSAGRGDGPRAGFSREEPCGLGAACDGGVATPCPPGKFASNNACLACFAGFVCPFEGSYRGDPQSCGNATVYCPPGSAAPLSVLEGFAADYYETAARAHGQRPCAPGFYCAGGLSYKCPAGRFGNSSRLSTPRCDGPCAAGRFCPDRARTEPRGFPCGDDATVFCPIGATAPSHVQEGWYSVESIAESPCEPGAYCVDGRRYSCPNGTYNDAYGASACVAAPPGRYSPGEGAVAPVACGAPSLLCPYEGMAAPRLVASGHYSASGGETTRTGQRVAPPGRYAVGGLLFTCPAGRFGATRGLADESCSGPCAPGYWCGSGATSPAANVCGGPDKICPRFGRVAPLPVEPGYYTTIHDDDDVVECPAGRVRAVQNATTPATISAIPAATAVAPCESCPAGRFQTSGGACRECDPWTSVSTADRRTCDCVRAPGGGGGGKDSLVFNRTSGSCVVVPSAAAAAFLLAQAAVAANGTTDTRTVARPCEQGYWCQEGVRKPCLAGRYGSLPRETRPNCSNPCEPGYFCPAASASATARRCGGAHLYCPLGSAEPSFVQPGYYSVGGLIDATTRQAQRRCPAGHYCVRGLRFPCAAGRFGGEGRSSSCEGLCERGYYCPEASTNATAVACGGPDRACPAGSAEPIPVPDGYYGVHSGAYADERAAGDPLKLLADAMLPCEAGYYCAGGIKRECPEFTFGWRTFASSPECDGGVAPGCYMPRRDEPYREACPFECGGVDRYCPERSLAPTLVAPGHYTVGINETRRTEQRPCPPGHACLAGVRHPCEAGRYQPAPRAARCSFWCPPGSYCPEGTSQPIPCPTGTFSVGHAVACAACPQKTTTRSQTCFHDRSCCCEV